MPICLDLSIGMFGIIWFIGAFYKSGFPNQRSAAWREAPFLQVQ